MSRESNAVQNPAGIRAVLDEFRALNPIASVGAVSLFLALGEAGGDLDVNQLAAASGMGVVQVCRYADNLTKVDNRPGKESCRLLRQEPAALGKTPRYSMTDAGRDLYSRLFTEQAPTLRVAA